MERAASRRGLGCDLVGRRGAACSKHTLHLDATAAVRGFLLGGLGRYGAETFSGRVPSERSISVSIPEARIARQLVRGRRCAGWKWSKRHREDLVGYAGSLSAA